MHSEQIDHMFRFTFEKSSEEIVKLAKTKVDRIENKIRERESRVVKIREEYKITDAVLIDLLTQARQRESSMTLTYSSNASVGASKGANEPVVVGAGVVKNILAEMDLIEAEKEQVKKLGFIIRNLRDLPDRSITSLSGGAERPLRGHILSYEELEFFGC